MQFASRPRTCPYRQVCGDICTIPSTILHCQNTQEIKDRDDVIHHLNWIELTMKLVFKKCRDARAL
jgi:hypothetical protein